MIRIVSVFVPSVQKMLNGKPEGKTDQLIVNILQACIFSKKALRNKTTLPDFRLIQKVFTKGAKKMRLY